MKTRLNNQLGLTIVELIIVMCIFGIFVAGAMLYYGDMTTTTNVQAAQKDLLSLCSNISSAYQAEPDFSALSTENAVNMALIPSSMLKGSDVHSAFGGDVTIEANSDDRYFDVTIDGIPGDACPKLAVFERGGWESVTVNGTDISQLPSDTVTATVGTACDEDTNTIVYTTK